MHDVLLKNVVFHGHFVICICPCLVWIDVASVKHYLNAIKAKSALNARKPLVGGRQPHLCSRPFGLELRSFKSLALIGIYHLLLSNLTTGCVYNDETERDVVCAAAPRHDDCRADRWQHRRLSAPQPHPLHHRRQKDLQLRRFCSVL